jgi:hypothetical protein
MAQVAMVISADETLRGAMMGVVVAEGWTADELAPAGAGAVEGTYDLLIFAPHQQDAGFLVHLSGQPQFAGMPLLWVGEEVSGLPSGSAGIPRIEVLTKLPTMLARAAIGASLVPKSGPAIGVSVVEGNAGFIKPLRPPDDHQSGF